eukprot:TRINITY_DN4542_c0_g1_i1.p1 TRINITY_DN4542_c0_g1~~TRINITY_DN4542_c0_g1_i1.p1  ORF type:complete len:547 (+),score=113.09 TRINITY_DN4542_c0_g1_i1:1470-3110(+)
MKVVFRKLATGLDFNSTLYDECIRTACVLGCHMACHIMDPATSSDDVDHFLESTLRTGLEDIPSPTLHILQEMMKKEKPPVLEYVRRFVPAMMGLLKWTNPKGQFVDLADLEVAAILCGKFRDTIPELVAHSVSVLQGLSTVSVAAKALIQTAITLQDLIILAPDLIKPHVPLIVESLAPFYSMNHLKRRRVPGQQGQNGDEDDDEHEQDQFDPHIQPENFIEWAGSSPFPDQFGRCVTGATDCVGAVCEQGLMHPYIMDKVSVIDNATLDLDPAPIVACARIFNQIAECGAFDDKTLLLVLPSLLAKLEDELVLIRPQEEEVHWHLFQGLKLCLLSLLRACERQKLPLTMHYLAVQFRVTYEWMLTKYLDPIVATDVSSLKIKSALHAILYRMYAALFKDEGGQGQSFVSTVLRRATADVQFWRRTNVWETNTNVNLFYREWTLICEGSRGPHPYQIKPGQMSSEEPFYYEAVRAIVAAIGHGLSSDDSIMYRLPHEVTRQIEEILGPQLPFPFAPGVGNFGDMMAMVAQMMQAGFMPPGFMPPI